MPTIELKELFTKELSALLTAQQDSVDQTTEGMKEAASPDLKRAFKTGVGDSRKQVTRIEKIFELTRITPEHTPNAIIAGVDEANRILLSEVSGPEERDLARISMSQAALHYYIAKYGTLRAYAHTLGYSKAVGLLEKSLEENKKGDWQLTKVARQILTKSFKEESSNKGSVGPVRSLFRLLAIAGLGAAAARALKSQQQQQPDMAVTRG